MHEFCIQAKLSMYRADAYFRFPQHDLFWSFRIVFVVSGFRFGRFACFGGFVSLVSVVSFVSLFRVLEF